MRATSGHLHCLHLQHYTDELHNQFQHLTDEQRKSSSGSRTASYGVLVFKENKENQSFGGSCDQPLIQDAMHPRHLKQKEYTDAGSYEQTLQRGI